MKIISANVNGFKLRASQIQNFIVEQNLDLMAFQELHFLEEDFVHNFEKEVKGTFFINSKERFKGTGILIRNNLQSLKTEHIEIKENIFQNRITHIKITAKDAINFISIYAPSGQEDLQKQNFYKKLVQYLENLIGQNVIILGDFNFVENNLDRLRALRPYDIYLQKIFKSQNLNLRDVYQYKHGLNQNFTRLNSRIDRIYISDFLVPKIKNVTHLDYLADHKPVSLDIELDGTKMWGYFYWKLNNFYLKDDFYKIEIKNLISDFHFSKIAKFKNTLDAWEDFKIQVAKISKSYGKMQASRRRTTIEIGKQMKENNFEGEILEKINQKEEEIQNFNLRGNIIRAKNQTLENIYSDGKELSRKEEIKKGNSKFMYQIQKENGEITYEKEEILENVAGFYGNLYKSQDIETQKIKKYLEDFRPNILGEDNNEILGHSITEEEIRIAIKNLNKNKSPGSDGITPEFYQTFVMELTPVLAELYNNMFLDQNLTESMKIGIISLIFKNKGTTADLKNWRPISLLNIDYKILTKILASRLKLISNEILNPFQSSGPKGRNILNNALNLKNIIHYIQQNNLNAALISFDNEKAFDRIEHNFIREVLEKYGFHKNFIKWFNILYSGIRSKVMVNGAFTASFDIMRSVRQGCPLSMILYVICLEPLIFKINKNQNIKSIKIPNCIYEIKSIQHADDMTDIVINDASYRELKSENEEYSKVSGSKINPNKTEILKFGNFQNLPEQYVKDHIKVLGIYLGKNDLNLNFRNRLEKLEKTIQKWTKFKLNIFTKTIILKTYIISILQYYMKIFPMSAYKLKIFNKNIFGFLWDQRKEKNARNVLFRDVYNGGIGIPNIDIRSKANFIQSFKLIDQNLIQPWASLYIYWFGFNLKFLNADYAKNKWVHTLNIPYSLQYLKRILIDFKNADFIWKCNLGGIYNMIIDQQNFKAIVEIRNPQLNWKMIWATIATTKSPSDKNILYKSIFGVLPTGDYLFKHKAIQVIQ